ncbi:MAG: TRAFs-binding domain-containing protein [bacterium]
MENDINNKISELETSEEFVDFEQIKKETSKVKVSELVGQTIDHIFKKIKETETTPSAQIDQIKNLNGSDREIGERTELVTREIEIVKENAVENIEHIAEYHELSNFLSNPEKIEGLDLKLLQSQTEELRESQRKFNSVFKSEVLKTSNKKEKGILTNKMLEETPLQNFTAGQTATVFNTFKQAGDFEKMITTYNQSESIIFKKSPVIRELLAVALHKAGELEKSEKVIHELINEGKGNGEVYAILGKIYKVRHDRLQSEDPVKASEFLKQSVDYLEKGFKNGFEFYPGINLTYNKITEGSNEKNVDKVQKALKTAELVYISAQKAGGMNSGDFWTLATVLESSLMTGRESETALNKVIEKSNVDWEINAPIENLERLKNQIGTLGGLKSENIIKNIDNALTKLKEKLKEIKEGTVSEKENTDQKIESKDKKAEATDFIFNNGFNYGEISSFVGGNIEYGGQLHSHVVNRWDISVGREFLKKAELNDITDFKEFNKKIDILIRQRYGTAPLEDLHSPEHKDFDDFMKKFNGALNVEKQDDSRTNVMVDFYLGKGDCRQHAYTKQLFFDIWKTDNINKILEESYDSLNKNDDKTFNEGIEKAKSLVNSQMFVFDSVVVAPMQMEKKYLPKGDEEGRKLLTTDGSLNEVEDHTWNGLVELDEEGVIKTFTKTDSFYQNEYKFGEGAETNIEDITTKGFSGGEFEVFDSVNNKTVKVEIKLTPTVYAGGREKRMKSRDDDLGSPLLRGLAIDDFFTSEGKLDVNNFFDQETNKKIKGFVNKVIRESSVEKNTLQDTL